MRTKLLELSGTEMLATNPSDSVTFAPRHKGVIPSGKLNTKVTAEDERTLAIVAVVSLRTDSGTLLPADDMTADPAYDSTTAQEDVRLPEAVLPEGLSLEKEYSSDRVAVRLLVPVTRILTDGDFELVTEMIAAVRDAVDEFVSLRKPLSVSDMTVCDDSSDNEHDLEMDRLVVTEVEKRGGLLTETEIIEAV